MLVLGAIALVVVIAIYLKGGTFPITGIAGGLLKGILTQQSHQ
jgi:hypothetical protein